MAKWQLILIGLTILISAFQGAMQYIEKDTFGESRHLKNFAGFTFENRAWLALVLGVASGLLTSAVILFQPYITQSKFRDSLMDGIFEQVLDNDKTKARITLFRDAGLFRRLWFKFLDFFGLWKRQWKIKDILKYCWEAKYIYIFKRWGTEHKNSRTHFCFNSETASRCQGLAGQVRQREEEIIVSLPSLEGIDLNTVDENDLTIKEFMKKGYISDFKVLRSINRIAPFIYGNIISVSGGKKKYVLVIDSWAKTSPFRSPLKRKFLSNFVKQISASFGT